MSTNTNKELEQFSEVLENFFEWFSKHRRTLFIFIIIIALILWLVSGIFIVAPGEEGVIRTFGKFSNISTSGLNYHWPWPIQSVTIVDVESIRRAEIGFRTGSANLKDQKLGEALMLTTDENIVQVELLVQYRIANSADFVFNVQEPEDILHTSTEVALRSTVGQMTIDAVITEERARVQDDTRVFLTRLLNDYGTGIQVTDVRLQVADPPEEVRDAFQEVVRAKADKERLINESQAYQNDVVPRARGDKQQQIEEATAFKDQQILRATGDASRFLSILKAYQLAPDVTRERMHIEALEDIFDQVGLILLDDEAMGNGNQVLPFLPLTDLNGSASNPTPNRSSLPPSNPPAPAEGGE